MPALAQGLRGHAPTGMAALRGFQGARGSLDIHDTSFCRFVSQDAKELRRGTVKNRFVESSLRGCAVGHRLPGRLILFGFRTTGHVGRLKFFRKDRRCSIHQLRGSLVMEVQTLTGNLAVELRHPLVGQAPAMRELLLGISGAVRGLESCFALPKKTRVVHVSARCPGSRWWQTFPHPNQRLSCPRHAHGQADRPAQSRHTSDHAYTRYRTSSARQTSAHPHGYGHARYPPTATAHAACPREAARASHPHVWDSSSP